MPRLRLVVLVSGRGTNLRSLLEASRQGRMDADVALVLSNKEGVGALDVAKEAGVPVQAVPSAGLPREAHEARLVERIDAAAPDLVVLAGYMRVLTPDFIRRYHGRLVNIHPSLLPAFPGLAAQEQAAAAGVRIAGCTTHFVSEEVDAGPVILQAAIAVPPDAPPEEVAARILRAEHQVYPMTIQMLATGRARLQEGRVVFRDAQVDDHVLVSPKVAL